MPIRYSISLLAKSPSRVVICLVHILVYSVFAVVLGIPSLSQSLLAAFFAAGLIWISIVDIEKFEIPDSALVGLTAVGITAVLGWSSSPIMDHFVGALIWPLLFWGVAGIYFKRKGFHGLGFGDVKLIGVIGLWCGFQNTVPVVLAASLSGLLVLLVYSVWNRVSAHEFGQSAVAFGPFLCLSAWGIWLLGLSG